MSKSSNSGNFIDDVLISLEREYGKDEYVLHLKKKLSDSEVEKGILKSELDECRHYLKAVKKDFKVFKEKTKMQQMGVIQHDMNREKNRAIDKYKVKIEELERINEQHQRDKMMLRIELHKANNK